MKVTAVTSYLVGALSPLNHIGLNPHKTRHFKANVKSKLIVCSSFREMCWRSNSADVFVFCSRRFSSLWAFTVNVFGVQDML